MCGMLLNDLAVHREIILPDVACTRTHVCTRDSTSVRVLSSLVSRTGSRIYIYVRAPWVTLKRCLGLDRVVMRLRVISGSQLTDEYFDLAPLPNFEERNCSLNLVILNVTLKE